MHGSTIHLIPVPDGPWPFMEGVGMAGRSGQKYIQVTCTTRHTRSLIIENVYDVLPKTYERVIHVIKT